METCSILATKNWNYKEEIQNDQMFLEILGLLFRSIGILTQISIATWMLVKGISSHELCFILVPMISLQYKTRRFGMKGKIIMLYQIIYLICK